jgi:hypothetical protein
MCEKNLYLRHLCKTSVIQMTGHFYERLEILSRQVAIPNDFRISDPVDLQIRPCSLHFD